jgi:uncharacterized membrane protein
MTATLNQAPPEREKDIRLRSLRELARHSSRSDGGNNTTTLSVQGRRLSTASGLVPVILPVHIVAGMFALLFGYVALYATKGAALHRKSGVLFVYAMVMMSGTGAVMDALRTSSVSTNVVAGMVTLYFVGTALLTVQPRRRYSARLDALSMGFGLLAGTLAFKTGAALPQSGRSQMAPLFLFAALCLCGVLGDLRMLSAGGLDGRRRIARHLWRMCFAMWIAAASFFWGPPRRVPEIIRIPALQAFAVLVPVAVMLYWLARLQARRMPPTTELGVDVLRLRP